MKKYTKPYVPERFKPQKTETEESIAKRIKACTRNGKLCVHRDREGGTSMCQYFINTGRRRNCPPGRACVHYSSELPKPVPVTIVQPKPKVTAPFFAARVRELRKLRQMTQTEFGASLNRHYHAVVNWERGHTKPSMKTIGEIGRIYNVSVDWLLGRSNEMEVNQK